MYLIFVYITYTRKWWHCRVEKILRLTSRRLFNCITKSRITPTLVWRDIAVRSQKHLILYQKKNIFFFILITYFSKTFIVRIKLYSHLPRFCHVFILFSSKKSFFLIFDIWTANIILIARTQFIIISWWFIKIILLWLVTTRPNK